jgi:peptidoglycan/LPS O-acetylase OafA/YrhL
MDGKRHLPSLDGLRGASILLVLVGHAGRPVLPVRAQWLLAPFANIGVTIFFVLSGFLITTLLMRERERTGTLSLRRFYIRRALRILPASYTYVGVVAALSALGLIVLKPHDIVCALLYVVDYHHDRAWYLGHLWSLSIEEQFYLVWPPALLVAGTHRAPYVAFALLVLAVALPGVPTRINPAWNPDLRLPNGTSAILIGCLLALSMERLRRTPVWTSRWWLAAFGVVAAIQVYLESRNRVIHGGQLLFELLVAAVLLRSLLVTGDAVGRMLNSRALVTLGTLSYSLYIWQQLFLVEHVWWHGLVFPLDIGVALGAATLSYVCIERPFLRLKDRFAA